MNASSAKTFGVVLAVLLGLLLLWPLKYLFLAPVGVAHGLSSGWHSLRAETGWIWPWIGFAGLFGLLVLAFWIAVLVWVYKDAEKRGMNALVWTLVVFFLHFIGFIVYLLVRTDHPIRVPGPAASGTAAAPTMPAPAMSTVAAPPMCPQCGKITEREHAFCPAGGARIKPVCSACGKPVESGWKACPGCGASL
jgi:RNA polymerase subunit RPABC4/transcription elongation factor Spt4